MDEHGLASVDGALIKAQEARIPLEDRGFLFGDGVFETLVAFGSQILDLDAHLGRLRRSADDILLDLPWSDSELRFEIETLVDAVKAPKSNIRLMVTRGTSIALKITPDLVPRKVIWCRSADPIAADVLTKGISLKRKTQPFTLRGPAAKHPNYLRSAVALAEVQRSGYDEVLWANSEGEFTEAATANIFFVARQGDTYEVVTPPAHSGILEGITRSKMLDICRKSGADVKEAVTFVDELPRFDEAFICSTVRGLVPVAKIDQHKLHTVHENSLFKALHGAYLRLTWEKLGRKVDWSTGREG